MGAQGGDGQGAYRGDRGVQGRVAARDFFGAGARGGGDWVDGAAVKQEAAQEKRG